MELLEDIIEEILLRLPASIVLKFRSVCKLFDRLSTAPAFISAHNRRSRAAPPSVLALHHDRLCRFQHHQNLQIYSTPFDGKETSLTGPYPFNLGSYVPTTCDGLVCYANSPTSPVYWIFNPAAGLYWTVPAPENEVFRFFLLGFYRHRSSGSYRLLFKNMLYDRYVVVTVGSNEVRDVGSSVTFTFMPINCRDQGASEATMLDEKLYILGFVMSRDNRKLSSVVIFDTEKENFGYIMLPNEVVLSETCPAVVLLETRPPSSKLLEIEGMMCMYNVHSVEEAPYLRVEMWVLMDCESGVWVKKKTRMEVSGEHEEGLVVVNYVTTLLLNLRKKGEKLLLVRWGKNNVYSTEKEFTFYCLYDRDIRNTIMASRSSFGRTFDYIKSTKSCFCITGYREALTMIDM